MGGFNIPQGTSLGGRFPGLARALLGLGQQQSWSEQPPVSLSGAMNGGWDKDPRLSQPTNRIQDDPISRNAPMGDGQAVTPVGQSTGMRGDDSHLQQMQEEYDQLGPQPQQPLSLKQKLLQGFVTALRPDIMQQRQMQANWQQQQNNQQRGRLLQEIEAERRMNTQESLADKRLTLQQQMEQDRFNQQNQLESQREKDREASQERLFGQQSQLENQRETLRQKMQADQQAAAQQHQDAQFAQQTAQQNRQFAEQEKLEGMRDARNSNRQDTSLREKVLGYWQPSLDSAERVNVMSKNYEDGVKNHDQQAMLSLLANHLGMTMGLQKGARLNQALITEAQKAQPWLQGIKAKFDKDGYLSGVTLSPMQMKQMVDLGFERYREDVKKSRSMSGYVGMKDEPPRQISKEAVGYYIDAAGGNAQKARQMAQQDGWTF